MVQMIQKKEFLTQLDRVTTGANVYIMGNFNAEVGDDRGGCENVTGTMVMQEEILKKKIYWVCIIEMNG
jgi:hypothetical protein